MTESEKYILNHDIKYDGRRFRKESSFVYFTKYGDPVVRSLEGDEKMTEGIFVDADTLDFWLAIDAIKKKAESDE